LPVAALVSVVYQAPFYVHATWTQCDTYTDVAGSTAFVVVSWFAAWQASFISTRLCILGVCVSVWAARLSVFSHSRMLAKGREPRLDGIRKKPASFLAFWLLQVLWSWMGTLPLVVAWSLAPTAISTLDVWHGATDAIAVVCWVGGLALESVADAQRLEHWRTRRAPTALCSHGVWAWSRHPNYFGEIALWFGFSLGCLPALRPIVASMPVMTACTAFAPPLFTALLLVGLFGMPLSEVYHAQRAQRLDYGPAYAAYIAATSPLVPMPPALWRRLPLCVKRVLFE
ncbi:hypothetical protein THASP1DRAFT_4011, partial [Thamnocephalis sphaerospora]